METLYFYVKWNPSNEDCLMLNTDASLCSNINIRGLGGVFLNRLGDWVMGFTAPTIAQDITNLEFLALSISNAT